MRKLISVLSAALATLVTTSVAEAAPVQQATVTVTNATGAPLKLFPLTAHVGSDFVATSIDVGETDVEHGTLELTPPAIPTGQSLSIALTWNGSAPGAWSAADTGCHTAIAAGAQQVTCVVKQWTPSSGGVAGPAPVGGPPPAPVPTTAPAAPLSGFAPSVDMSAWRAPSFSDYATHGITALTLGFVTAVGSECTPAWGGYGSEPAAGPTPYLGAQVAAFNGTIIPSFGGAAGEELAETCGTPDALAGAYQSVIDAYAATRIDFDLEGAALTDTASLARRDQAIAILEARNPGLGVTFSLPVEPLSGLTNPALVAVQNALANNVRLTGVNALAMNYTSFVQDLGDAAIEAGTTVYNQLRTLYPNATGRQIWGMVGLTPMLGANDVAGQVFTVADATELTGWASTRQIGMLGAWALNALDGTVSPYDFTPAFEQF